MSDALMPRPMVLDEFLPFVGRTWLADCTPRTAKLTLVEATPHPRQSSAERVAFTLIFRTDPEILLTAGTYPLACDRFGPELIHVSPILAPLGSPAGYYYQAAFT